MFYAPSKALSIYSEAVAKGDRVIIVDGIVASGGSALAAIKLTKKPGAQCVGILCLAAFPNWRIKLLSWARVLVHAIACWRSRPHAWLAKGSRASRAQGRNVQAAAVRKEQWCVLEKEANQSATT